MEGRRDEARVQGEDKGQGKIEAVEENGRRGEYVEGAQMMKAGSFSYLGSPLENGVGALECDCEFFLQISCDGESGESLKLRRRFVAEKEGDSAEILPELAFASNLNNVVFVENPAVLRDEFEEVFFSLCRNGAV